MTEEVLISKEKNILDKIVKEKNIEVSELKKPRRSLKEKLSMSDISLIAEIKKASPSKGLIAEDFNPEKQLENYIRGGADAVSVLTDKKFFQGEKKYLKELREKTDLPFLRKDFIIDPIQVYESFFIGADIILLIAAILTEEKLSELLTISRNLGIEALVEVHNFEDLKKAETADAEILGINNRDLTDFTVSLENTEKIIRELNERGIRDEFYIVAESGIKERSDIEFLENLGVEGVLIGETLMRSGNPEQTIEELFPEKLKR
ncbi:MAG: indole-3-glycerol phosphate synthase TrpC [Bacillota bacterium]